MIKGTHLAALVAVGLTVILGMGFTWFNQPQVCAPEAIQAEIIFRERPQMGPLEREMWQKVIAREAAKFNLDPLIVTAKIAEESRFRCCLTSGKGAAGASQLMPMHHVKGTDPFEIEPNVAKGVKVLADAMREYKGDVEKGLRRYNGSKYAAEKMEETRNFAARIVARIYWARKSACSWETV